MIGERVFHYKILEKIGDMGVVYRTKDTKPKAIGSTTDGQRRSRCRDRIPMNEARGEHSIQAEIVRSFDYRDRWP